MLGKINIKKLSYQLIVMLLVGMIILVGQKIGYKISIIKALPGMIMLIIAAMSAMLVKELFPKSIFPAFGWATIIGLVLSMPYSPTSKIFLSNVQNVNFMAITTPLLAFAGISVGNKINELKKMSWKIIVISLVVFTGIFFSCALIAQVVLKLQNKI
ncbi:MAG: hypothetical protein ACRCSK_01085 [Fusobacteriaceae bacterium]